jgi:Tfp pilus assembly protein PilX
MRRMHSAGDVSPRRGVALVIVLAILAMISLYMATITAQILSNRRTVEHRGQQLQAASLARAGIERACSRLLSDSRKYTGESIELVPNSQLRIEVQPDPKSKETFLVTSEAFYPADNPHGIKRLLARRLQRVSDGPHVRIEVQPADSS